MVAFPFSPSQSHINTSCPPFPSFSKTKGTMALCQVPCSITRLVATPTSDWHRKPNWRLVSADSNAVCNQNWILVSADGNAAFNLVWAALSYCPEFDWGRSHGQHKVALPRPFSMLSPANELGCTCQKSVEFPNPASPLFITQQLHLQLLFFVICTFHRQLYPFTDTWLLRFRSDLSMDGLPRVWCTTEKEELVCFCSA